jgi:NADPH-dependent curcumin reductase CurA
LASKGQVHSRSGKLGKGTIWSGIADGRIPSREEIVDRLENASKAFIAVVDGHNFDKAIARVAA